MAADPRPPRHHDCAFCGPGCHDCALASATSSAQAHKPLLGALLGQQHGEKDLMSVDQGPPCPCSLALQVPRAGCTHHTSCLNTDSHALPWMPAPAGHWGQWSQQTHSNHHTVPYVCQRPRLHCPQSAHPCRSASGPLDWQRDEDTGPACEAERGWASLGQDSPSTLRAGAPEACGTGWSVLTAAWVPLVLLPACGGTLGWAPAQGCCSWPQRLSY